MKHLTADQYEVPQIELKPIDSLVAYARNSRTHSKAQVDQLQRLLIEYGWTNPVLIDADGIVAGHGRCMAAAEIYRKNGRITFPGGAPIPIGMVPTLDCSGWTDAQRRAYIISDNRSAMSSGWDEEILALELNDLQGMDFDLSLTAFDEDELADLMMIDALGDESKDPDHVPDDSSEPVCREGDVWVLGDHRLAVGDSTDPDVWALLMQGEQADIALIDPPYGVDLERKNRLLDQATGGNRNATAPIKNDKLNQSQLTDFMAESYTCLFSELRPGATIYVFHSDKFANIFRNELETAGFVFSQMLIWRKNNIVLGPARYLPIHEPIIVGRKPGGKSTWRGARKQKTIVDLGESSPFHQLEDGRWQIRIGDDVMIVDGSATVERSPTTMLFEPKPAKSGLHQSQKPIALCERLLRNSARPGDIVIDGFGGSGSTLIAAEGLGMRSRICEADLTHAETICRRFWHFTGIRPVHVNGELFPDDGEQRAPEALDFDDADVF